MLASIGGALQKRIARQKVLDQVKKDKKAQEMRVRVAREKIYEGMVFTPGPQKDVPPEDLLTGAGNPDIYLDKLPQPYRFINNCLENLVLGRVWERIKEIEEQKRLG